VATTFADELRNWGPSAVGGPLMPVRDANAYCRRLAITHYENFPVASWLLPRRLRQHFYNVYAFCRWADDLADEVTGPQRSLELLGWWRRELHACYDGTATHPVFVALRVTVDRFRIPAEPFDHLISAFEQDQRVWEYETFDELLDYCRRSANPVGRLVLYVCERHTPSNVALADSVCTGLQLANFWQDVDRDLQIGRIYLPAEDCERFDYRREDLRARTMNSAFVNLMRFEVERARRYLTDGLSLVERMPGRLQLDVEAFARGGLRILERIEETGYTLWKTRPVLTRHDGRRLVWGCACRAVFRRLGIAAHRSVAAARSSK